MDLKEYYKFPEGTNVTLSFAPNYFVSKPNFPCPQDMSYAFYQYKGIYVPPLDTSRVTNMNSMFYYGTNLVDVNMGSWDTSNVTDMSSMFYSCPNLISIDLSGWDTSNVTDMSSMFRFNRTLEEFIFPPLNISKLTKMSEMFSDCSNLAYVDFSQIDTSKVTNMNKLVGECPKLVTISSIDCSGLSAKNYYPLYTYSNTTTLTDVGGFLNMKMSWDNNYGLTKYPNLTYESCINILNGLYDFTGNGETPTSNQGTLKVHSNFLTTVGDEISIGTSKGWKITS